MIAWQNQLVLLILTNVINAKLSLFVCLLSVFKDSTDHHKIFWMHIVRGIQRTYGIFHRVNASEPVGKDKYSNKLISTESVFSF